MGVALVLVAAEAAIARLRAALGSLRGRRRLAFAAVTGSVAAPLLHAAVDFPLHIPGIAYLVLLVAAAGLRLADAADGGAAR